MKEKTKIRMVVQGPDEPAAEFARRLELCCEEFGAEFEGKTHMPPIVVMTASSSGRQTATMQLITHYPEGEANVFSSIALTGAYMKWKDSMEALPLSVESVVDDFYNYLFELKIKDLP